MQIPPLCDLVVCLGFSVSETVATAQGYVTLLQEVRMLIGVPKEIKVHEYRVGMTPASVREAVHHGHQV
ncbi:MAG: hypothetical protein KUG61_08800, partial [Parvibaculaceae bacterium]|nr:hypothetical protein [Parvibaculaceae bacterium]